MTADKSAEKREEEVAERTAPSGDVVYQAVYEEGKHELSRGSTALAVSGLAAGLSMGFSFMAEALLGVRIGDTPWAILVTKLGYSLGFLITILGRQQLFTKNTLTVILPLLKHKTMHILLNVARLWVVVLAANLVGAFVFAWVAANTPAFDADAHAEFGRIARHAVEPAVGALVVRGVLAGWLIALMVWLLPFAESARIWVIILLGYLVGIANLPHLIAGSVESFYLLATGTISVVQCFGGYLLPTLIGNVIGGAALVAFGAHAEFMAAGPTDES